MASGKTGLPRPLWTHGYTKSRTTELGDTTPTRTCISSTWVSKTYRVLLPTRVCHCGQAQLWAGQPHQVTPAGPRSTELKRPLVSNCITACSRRNLETREGEPRSFNPPEASEEGTHMIQAPVDVRGQSPVSVLTLPRFETWSLCYSWLHTPGYLGCTFPEILSLP